MWAVAQGLYTVYGFTFPKGILYSRQIAVHISEFAHGPGLAYGMTEMAGVNGKILCPSGEVHQEFVGT